MEPNQTQIDHNIIKKPFIFFLFGIIIYLFIFLPIEWFKPFGNNTLAFNIKLFLTFVILIFNGYHIMFEGFVETLKKTKKSKKFIPNIHILMTLAALGSVCLGNQNEAIILIIIFAGANFLEEYTDAKSQKEIKNLLKILPTKARLLKDNDEIEIVDVQKLQINDRLLILNGDQIPSDGIILSGNSTINESNITGEHLPVDKKQGDYVFGSTINITNTFIMKINTKNDDTIFAKIVKLINQNKDNISEKATFIKKIEPIYVNCVLILSLIFFLIGFVLNKQNEFFNKILIFLTVASPCALAVADIPATLSAISHLTRKRILIKGGKILEMLSKVQNFAFDKTGTLTKGKPIIKDFIFEETILPKDQQKYLDILFAIEKKSNHPLAFAIKNYLFQKIKNNFLDIKVKNLIGIGMEGYYNNDYYLVGKTDNFKNVSSFFKLKTKQFLSEGKTVIYFSCNQKIIILITISDTIRDHVYEIIEYFNQKKINTFMITGDNFETAMELQKKINFKKIFYNILPQQKSQIIDSLKTKYGLTAMMGDGVNDAPALVNADISLTTQEGTDIAMDVSDIVLMKDNLQQIIYLHLTSLKLKKILWQNIIFALIIILLLTIINLLNIGLNLWIAVTIHELSTILVILNSLRMLKEIK